MDAIAWTIATLKTTPARWLALTETLPDELLRQAPKPGEWSAVGCLQHLVDTEQRVFQFRVECLLAEKDFPAFNPDTEGTTPGADQSPLALARAFAAMRETGLSALAAVTPDDLGKQARHAELGMVTLENLLSEWAAHDLMHTVQAERALMQPYIKRCGPWLPYFADHVAT